MRQRPSKPGTPLDQKQQELAQRQSQLRSEMQELERNRLAMETELGPNVRLSCQIRVHSDLHVRVINQASVRGIDPGPRPFDE